MKIYANEFVPMVELDSQRAIADLNEAFAKQMGYKLSDVRGQSLAVLRSGLHQNQFYLDLWGEVEAVGHWNGEIWLRNRSGTVGPYQLSIFKGHRDSLSDLRFFAIVQPITLSNISIDEINQVANFDPLTGLANRAFLMNRLPHLLARCDDKRRHLALFFIDLDGFKEANDRWVLISIQY
jgi:PAS domain S-box-containing protein